MNAHAGELTVAMALALESCEADIARACTLLDDRADALASRELAQQLLGRALRRLETVRTALSGDGAGVAP